MYLRGACVAKLPNLSCVIFMWRWKPTVVLLITLLGRTTPRLWCPHDSWQASAPPPAELNSASSVQNQSPPSSFIRRWAQWGNSPRWPETKGWSVDVLSTRGTLFHSVTSCLHICSVFSSCWNISSHHKHPWDCLAGWEVTTVHWRVKGSSLQGRLHTQAALLQVSLIREPRREFRRSN